VRICRWSDHRDRHSLPTRRSSDLYPFGRSTPLAQVVSMITTGAQPSMSETWPVLYRSLIRSCIAFDPHTRPEMATVTPYLLFHRSEEHTSELQSRENLVCRPLLEK